jgi:hypothetical protein
VDRRGRRCGPRPARRCGPRPAHAWRRVAGPQVDRLVPGPCATRSAVRVRPAPAAIAPPAAHAEGRAAGPPAAGPAPRAGPGPTGPAVEGPIAPAVPAERHPADARAHAPPWGPSQAARPSRPGRAVAATAAAAAAAPVRAAEPPSPFARPDPAPPSARAPTAAAQPAEAGPPAAPRPARAPTAAARPARTGAPLAPQPARTPTELARTAALRLRWVAPSGDVAPPGRVPTGRVRSRGAVPPAAARERRAAPPWAEGRRQAAKPAPRVATAAQPATSNRPGADVRPGVPSHPAGAANPAGRSAAPPQATARSGEAPGPVDRAPTRRPARTTKSAREGRDRVAALRRPARRCTHPWPDCAGRLVTRLGRHGGDPLVRRRVPGRQTDGRPEVPADAGGCRRAGPRPARDRSTSARRPVAVRRPRRHRQVPWVRRIRRIRRHRRHRRHRRVPRAQRARRVRAPVGRSSADLSWPNPPPARRAPLRAAQLREACARRPRPGASDRRKLGVLPGRPPGPPHRRRAAPLAGRMDPQRAALLVGWVGPRAAAVRTRMAPLDQPAAACLAWAGLRPVAAPWAAAVGALAAAAVALAAAEPPARAAHRRWTVRVGWAVPRGWAVPPRRVDRRRCGDRPGAAGRSGTPGPAGEGRRRGSRGERPDPSRRRSHRSRCAGAAGPGCRGPPCPSPGTRRMPGSHRTDPTPDSGTRRMGRRSPGEHLHVATADVRARDSPFTSRGRRPALHSRPTPVHR